MKKQILLTTTLVSLLVAPCYAQSIADSEGEFTVTPAFVSDYMFRGVRLGGLSFQPTFEYSKGPLTLGLFASTPLNENKKDMPEYLELDFYASYEWTIIPDVFTITPGITAYTYPNINEMEDGFYKMTYEPSVSFGYAFNDINFSLNLYYDLVMKGTTYEFGIDYSIPLKAIGSGIELSAMIGKYDWSDTVPKVDDKEANWGSYWQAGISVPYEFSDNAKLTVGWFYTKGYDIFYQTKGDIKYKNESPDTRGFFSVSFSYSF